jgi:hypothetical protein
MGLVATPPSPPDWLGPRPDGPAALLPWTLARAASADPGAAPFRVAVRMEFSPRWPEREQALGGPWVACAPLAGAPGPLPAAAPVTEHLALTARDPLHWTLRTAYADTPPGEDSSPAADGERLPWWEAVEDRVHALLAPRLFVGDLTDLTAAPSGPVLGRACVRLDGRPRPLRPNPASPWAPPGAGRVSAWIDVRTGVALRAALGPDPERPDCTYTMTALEGV